MCVQHRYTRAAQWRAQAPRHLRGPPAGPQHRERLTARPGLPVCLTPDALPDDLEAAFLALSGTVGRRRGCRIFGKHTSFACRRSARLIDTELPRDASGPEHTDHPSEDELAAASREAAESGGPAGGCAVQRSRRPVRLGQVSELRPALMCIIGWRRAWIVSMISSTSIPCKETWWSRQANARAGVGSPAAAPPPGPARRREHDGADAGQTCAARLPPWRSVVARRALRSLTTAAGMLVGRSRQHAPIGSSTRRASHGRDDRSTPTCPSRPRGGDYLCLGESESIRVAVEI